MVDALGAKGRKEQQRVKERGDSGGRIDSSFLATMMRNVGRTKIKMMS